MVRRSSSVMPGSAAGGARRMDVPGWPAGPTVIQRGVRVVVREEARVNGDVHGSHSF
jgi:hypothetical protein